MLTKSSIRFHKFDGDARPHAAEIKIEGDACDVQRIADDVRAAGTTRRWMLIPTFLGYEVSDAGEVRNAFTKRPLKASPSDGGYLQIKLRRDDGERRWVKIHAAVLIAFVGPRPSDKHHGAHRDGRKWNNALDNLKWSLPVENEADKKNHGTQPKGMLPHAKQLSPAQRWSVRRSLARGKSITEIAKRYGVHRKTIAKLMDERG